MKEMVAGSDSGAHFLFIDRGDADTGAAKFCSSLSWYNPILADPE
jgi:hypothetical protein